MSSLCKVMILGLLGKDAEVKRFNNGGAVMNLRVATSETWKDRESGERQERTQWHNVVVRNQTLSDRLERYLKKGTRVYIEGTLETRKYTAEGVERSVTEIVVKPYGGELKLLGDASRNGSGERRQADERPARSNAPARQSGGTDYFGGAAPDDQIPF
jgi:single-strand DNA-binding protein